MEFAEMCDIAIGILYVVMGVSYYFISETANNGVFDIHEICYVVIGIIYLIMTIISLTYNQK